MRIHITSLFIVVSLLAACNNDDEVELCDSEDLLFAENDGLLIIESEAIGTVTDNWNFSTLTTDFTGNSYIEWRGDNHFSNPGNGYLAYPLSINTPGTYRFQWRSRINTGNSNTEHNDAWLRFPDADEFFAQKNNSIIYPKGTGKSPNPNGQSKDGWFKIYQNQRDRWSWQAKTSDNDAHDVYVTFNNAGNYLMEISGRSTGFAIDRIVLYTNNIETSLATDVTTPATEPDCNN